VAIPSTLGGRIAQARREKGVRDRRDVTQLDLAQAVGVANASLSRWEADLASPREEALAKLAAYLGVTPAFLRYGVTEPDLPFRDAPPATFERIPTKAEREAAAKKRRA
jgi:transcriptional regulator with XRE-family HTH domain